MDICVILTYHNSRGQYDLGTRETLSFKDRPFFLFFHLFFFFTFINIKDWDWGRGRGGVQPLETAAVGRRDLTPKIKGRYGRLFNPTAHPHLI